MYLVLSLTTGAGLILPALPIKYIAKCQQNSHVAKSTGSLFKNFVRIMNVV